MNRRTFLRTAGSSAAAALWSESAFAQKTKAPPSAIPLKAADHHLIIEKSRLELAPGIKIDTITYNGTVPGPLLRMKHGVPVTIDVDNKTNAEELVHWHGFDIDPINDGAMEEGSPMITAGGRQRYAFTPNLTGSRWYHTHVGAGKDLTRSAYTGQFGFAYVEPVENPGDFDQEIFLPIHHWGPSISMQPGPVGACDVGYKYASFNDKLFSASAPIQVKPKQRILFRFLNASATKNVTLALPGHQFRVIALDGNPVPMPSLTDVIFLAVAERVDAIVEMSNPGVWMLGSTDKTERESGLALAIEYAGNTGTTTWVDPASPTWDYLRFGKPASTTIKADEVLMMIFGKKPGGAKGGMDLWMINGKSWPEIDPIKITRGKRYRLSMMNASQCVHPVHLHRHVFEVMSLNGKASSGILKDTLNLDPFGRAEVDFVANNPGPSLFHCHHQLHMDYGFMQLIQYV